MTAERFDAGYYHRFYRDPRTRVTERATVRRLARFVCGYLAHLDIEVETVLDIGCGLGLWRAEIRRHFPDAEYVGVEISRHACEEHGWERGSVVDWQPDEPGDLVICQGVLQYLPAKDARRAIDNLASMTRGALYLEALTREDWEHNVTRETTDGDVHLRRAHWYRKALGEHFIACGGGVFVPRDDPPILYELEKPG